MDNSIYEMTLNQEVIREVSNGVRIDLENYIEKNNIVDPKNPLILLKDKAKFMYNNVFNHKVYRDNEDLIKALGQLRLMNDIIKEIGA